MKCPACNANNAQGAKFCSNCGTRLAVVCSNCGTVASAGAKFCSNCGNGLEPAATNPSSPPIVGQQTGSMGGESPPGQVALDRFIPKELQRKLEQSRVDGRMVGERRTVTMLFCDVQGSTAAASGLDPEEWAGIINGAFKEMIQPIYRYEGTVARLMGDGLLAFFGAPIAHEDDPQRAVMAGLGIVEGLRPYSEAMRDEWGLDLSVRVGVNTGLVVVGAVGSDLRMEYSALGDAINLAARMEQTAQPGTVQISAATYRLVAPLFDVEVIEGLEVKGKIGLQTVYRILGRKATPGSLRGLTGLESPLVGREHEFAALTGALEGLRQGRGRIISLIGEAGLGKSRLATEARRAVPNCRWAEGKSLSYETSTPFAPFGGLLASLLNLERDADFAQIAERLEVEAPNGDRSLASYLATMLGVAIPSGDDEAVRYLEPPMLRMAVFKAVASLVQGIAARSPLVLALDDVHWIDPSSLDLVRFLLPLTDSLPLAILLAFRPRPGDPSWDLHEFAGREFTDGYMAIELWPLGEAEARELVRNLLAIEDLPEPVRQLMLDKSEGNPFFLEEVIRSLLDAGLVVREDDHWRATREIVKLNLPETLVGVITARLDRLDEPARAAAQAAAVLGREFDVQLLAEISDATSLPSSLATLQARGLIREKEGAPESFVFKHVLTREAAYESLLLSSRRQLHHRAADAVASWRPDQAAVIAHHYMEARQPGKAVPYLVRAGQQAAAAFALREAMGFFQQALDHADVATPADLRFAYEGLGAAQAMRDPVQALATYEKMLGAAEALADAPMTVSALNRLAGVNSLSLGRFGQGDVYLTRAERMAREEDVLEGFAEASIIRCQMCTAQADFSRVIEYMDQVVGIGETMGNPFLKTLGLEHTASSLMFLTQFDEAYEKVQEAILSARTIGDRMHEAWALSTTLSICHCRNGNLDAALASLDEGLHIANRIGAAIVVVYGEWLRATIHLWRGEYERALAAAERALQAALPMEGFADFVVVQPMGVLGMVLLVLDGRLTDRVAELHRHALRLLETPGGMAAGGTAWADLGWCALAVGDAPVARDVFEKGLNHPTMFMLLEKPRHLAGMAMVRLVEGDLSEASALADEAWAYTTERQMRYFYPLLAYVRGTIRAAAGRHKEALACYAEGEATAAEMSMRPLWGQLQTAAAASLAALGEHGVAEIRLQGARQTAEEIAGLFGDESLRRSFSLRAMAWMGGGAERA